MAQKNETVPLVLSLLITLGVIGGGIWWFTRSTEPQNNPVASNPTNRNNNKANTDHPPSFAEVDNVPQGLFNYGGSTTWAPIREEVDSVIQQVYPSFELRYTQPAVGAPGSGTGIKMLLDNQLAFSQSSRPIKEEEYAKARERGFGLQEIPVAIDGIAIAVHPNLNLPGLTTTQLKEIYTGNIANWSEVGGPNLPITPYSRPLEAGGTVEFFVGNVLADAEFGDNVEIIPTTTQALRSVSTDQGGIYYASAPEVVPQCTVKTLPLGRTSEKFFPPYQHPFIPLSNCPQERNQLNSEAFKTGDYPITRRLFVIVKQNGQEDQQAGEAYAQLILTDQGQNLVTEAGFVRLR